MPASMALATAAVVFVAVAAASPGPGLQTAPIRPRVEYTEGTGTALGIDEASPRFSWALPSPAATPRGEAQAAYQLVITRQGTAQPLYDSGKVLSKQRAWVTANASTVFPPDASFDWGVRWWSSSTGSDSPSPWLHSTFSTGIGSGSSMAPWCAAGLRRTSELSPAAGI